MGCPSHGRDRLCVSAQSGCRPVPAWQRVVDGRTSVAGGRFAKQKMSQGPPPHAAALSGHLWAARHLVDRTGRQSWSAAASGKTRTWLRQCRGLPLASSFGHLACSAFPTAAVLENKRKGAQMTIACRGSRRCQWGSNFDGGSHMALLRLGRPRCMQWICRLRRWSKMGKAALSGVIGSAEGGYRAGRANHAPTRFVSASGAGTPCVSGQLPLSAKDMYRPVTPRRFTSGK